MKAFTLEKSSAPTGLVWNTNMAAVKCCENALYVGKTFSGKQDIFSPQIPKRRSNEPQRSSMLHEAKIPTRLTR